MKGVRPGAIVACIGVAVFLAAQWFDSVALLWIAMILTVAAAFMSPAGRRATAAGITDPAHTCKGSV